MSGADPRNAPVRLAVILCIGRSGSTLLRNELAKPDDVSGLTSDFGYRWMNRHQMQPGGSVPDASEMRAIWRDEAYGREEIKARFALSPGDGALRRILLLKFALFGFGGLGLSPFEQHRARTIFLIRDPLDVALSHCRPLAWNGGAAFWAGPRADRLPANLRLISEFSRAVGFPPPDPAEILDASYPVAIAAFLKHYYALLAHVVGASRDGTFLIVRFEDFVTLRRAELARLADFIGIEDRRFPDNALFYKPVVEEGGIHLARNTGTPVDGGGISGGASIDRNAMPYALLSEHLRETRRHWGYPEG